MEATITISLEKYEEMKKEIETLREGKTGEEEDYLGRIVIFFIALWLCILFSQF